MQAKYVLNIGPASYKMNRKMIDKERQQMSSLSLLSIPAKAAAVRSQSMPPDMILLNLNSGYYYSTNPVGAAVWACCDGLQSVRAIISEVAAAFGVPAEEVQGDILDFLTDMAGEGLLRV
ncbi:hypothetical protein BG53_01860 [Paenibacillus darwinianus]|uniref:PqqD family protein n=2 Tax=Paenibacillus darwinianus TaxID=1380763 RepID=A0A9W5S1C4_9BACL|nr:hypothetical protein BG52_03885 [Paenibacillus darwinianus]EXX88492.1 hypothetical protein BG53_01860 [Paenibacillus darwinianus]EXX88700.1 hypothetical protein CH50_02930 [Paenibacillus darwinianus]